MRIVSVNVGLPRIVIHQGKEVTTGIYKSPVEDPVMVCKLNLAGDQQADLRVHGGVEKAVYAYPYQHYASWRQDFPQHEFPIGVFGENLTVSNLDESTVCIGDRFRARECELQVTQPRFPCFKLGIRFDDPKMIRHFLQRNQPGVYFSVVKEGVVQKGDSLTLLKKSDSQLTITDIVRLYTVDKENKEGIRAATNDPHLPQSWQEYFAKKLEKLSS